MEFFGQLIVAKKNLYELELSKSSFENRESVNEGCFNLQKSNY